MWARSVKGSRAAPAGGWGKRWVGNERVSMIAFMKRSGLILRDSPDRKGLLGWSRAGMSAAKSLTQTKRV